MQWFINLKIAQKMAVLISLLIFFIGVIGFVGYHYSGQMANNTKSMYEDNLMPIELYNEIRVHSYANRVNVLKIVLTKDPQKRQEYAQDVKDRVTAGGLLFPKIEKGIKTEYERKGYDKFKTQLGEYRGIRNKLIELALAGKKDEVINLLDEEARLFDSYAATLQDLTAYNIKLADKAKEKNEKDKQLVQNIILVSIFISIIISLVFGFWMTKMFARRFGNLIKLTTMIADGDFTANFKIEAKDELGQTGVTLNNTAARLRKLIHEITNTVEQVTSGSEEMYAAADQTAQGSQQVSISVTQLASGAGQVSQSVEEGAANVARINQAIQEISEEAKDIAKLGNDTEINANAGKDQVKKAVDKIGTIKDVAGEISETIGELGILSSEIEQIVDLIKNIASQTNLLALNAAIEAARAGEHGKGFAVVAEEVKKLATESGEATDKITTMIKEIQAKTQIAVTTVNKASSEVEEGVVVVNNAGNALENIINQVKSANYKIQGITQEIDGLAKNSEDIVHMIENIASITEETAASAEEISSITEEQTASLEEINASSQTLAKMAEDLNNQIRVFKI